MAKQKFERSKTQGRGTYTMQFDHYEELPKALTEQIIKSRGYQA